jgi:hypothetical protein
MRTTSKGGKGTFAPLSVVIRLCLLLSVVAVGSFGNTVIHNGKGGFTSPSEPCVWKGSVYVANYRGTTLEVVPLCEGCCKR